MSNADDLFSDLPPSTPVAKVAETTAPTPVKKLDAPKPRRVTTPGEDNYSAADIEVLEGLEPVRRRPGMYIGGTDERALHHLFAEVIDNCMDEAVAGHATWIDVALDAHGYLSVGDNGRGIPIDPHPKYPGKSALEVIMTTLHAGGKFDSKVYETSGGLHGVGISVVNALSDDLLVEIARGKRLYRQRFAKGLPNGGLEDCGAVPNRRGTLVRFRPDPEIFGASAKFKPQRLYKMAQSKAYLFGGVEVCWNCAPELLEGTDVPPKATFHFPGGLSDFLKETIGSKPLVAPTVFAGKAKATGSHGAVEWAIAWFGGGDGFVHSYCNTVPTADGGTHESGLRIALLRGIKNFGELSGNKRVSVINSDDVMVSMGAMLSVFIREPEFQGQTKDRLATAEASRVVEQAIRDPFDHWMAENPAQSAKLLDWIVERAEDRIRRRQERDVKRASAVRKLRLPGKLADCSRNSAEGTEIFIVEGDSAGGSAKQARNRATQAILPLRGKILNVANAGRDKLNQNQQLGDILQALGCGSGTHYRDEDLRYEKVIIMTDADVDGAHIASLLITFFFREMKELIENGHLFLAVPPLYRLSQGGKTLYARDDDHKDQLMETVFTGRGKVDIGRFKGLGEMLPAQLKETTMAPTKRTLLRVAVIDQSESETSNRVTELMGTKPEARFAFIQDRAAFVTDLDV